MVSKKTSDSLSHALALYFSEIENTEPLDPEAQIMKESLTEEIKRLLNAIPEREAMIIEYYFGIDVDRSLTLEEIGDQLRLTREESQAIERTCYKTAPARN